MGVRQYIGARYVPKFYEGSNGSQWDSGVMYEPLTIVQYLTNTYCSKKTVPSTVGAPNLNPDYWANIGLLGEVQDDIAQLQLDVNRIDGEISDINDNVTDLSNDVDRIDGTIETVSDDLDTAEDNITSHGNQLTSLEKYIKNKKVALFGDSLSDENITWSTDVDYVWVKPFRDYIQSMNCTVDNYSVSSIGYYTKVDGSDIADIVSATSLSEYDTVILFAGVNDYLQGAPLGAYYDSDSTNTFWGRLNKIKARVRNKNVFVVTPLPVFVQSAPNRVKGYTLEMYRCALANWAIYNGFMLINGVGISCIGKDSEAYQDGLHIKNAYTWRIAEKIFKSILAGGCEYVPMTEIAEQTVSISGITNAKVLTRTIGLDEVEISVNGTLTSEVSPAATDLNTIPIFRTQRLIYGTADGLLLNVEYQNTNTNGIGGRIGVYAPGQTVTSNGVNFVFRGFSVSTSIANFVNN